MSKKQLYIIVGIFAIITLGFFLASFVLTQGNKKPDNNQNGSISNFFPFGNSNNTTTTSGGKNQAANDPNSQQNIATGVKKNLPILRQITKKAVAGLYATQKSGKSYVNYTEKETGNVFETRLEDMQTNRLSNSIMPRISEAYFANQGNSVIVRYLKNKGDTVSSFILDIQKTAQQDLDNASTSATLPNGRFLPAGVMNMVVSDDEKTAFYLTRSEEFNNRSSFGSVYDFEKNTVSEVFHSPFSEWLPVSFNSKNVLLQTKASQNVPGYLYSFNIKTGILQKIIGGINGLTTLPSPDGQHILYSNSTKGGLALHVLHSQDRTTTDLILKTLPEKCVWKNDNVTLYCAIPGNIPSMDYPDAWYQGTVSFSDNIWQVDTKIGKVTTILTSSGFTMDPLDMTSLTLSPLQDYIYFVNKNNSSLWAFEVGKAEI